MKSSSWTTARRVAAFFAHPDDEFFASGLLYLSAQRGATVTVVTATKGEAGGVSFELGASRERTAVIRTQELIDSCAILGLEPPRHLSFPDGGVDTDALLPEFSAVVAQLDPDLVVTLGPDGGYGHRDHLAVTAAVERLLRGRVAILEAVFPVGLFAPVWHFVRRRHPGAIANVELSDLGTDVSTADLTLDTRDLADIRTRSLAAHRSQFENSDPTTFLGKNFIDGLLDHEYYRLVS